MTARKQSVMATDRGKPRLVFPGGISSIAVVLKPFLLVYHFWEKNYSQFSEQDSIPPETDDILVFLSVFPCLHFNHHF